MTKASSQYRVEVRPYTGVGRIGIWVLTVVVGLVNAVLYGGISGWGPAKVCIIDARTNRVLRTWRPVISTTVNDKCQDLLRQLEAMDAESFAERFEL